MDMKVFNQTAATNPLGPAFKGVRPAQEAGGASDFLSMLKSQIAEVNDLQHEADAASSGLALGKVGIQEAMIAVQKADVSFRYMMQIRNKAIEAYREVMRMQF
jgi:flagellar hook-basal body complex protein FliE